MFRSSLAPDLLTMLRFSTAISEGHGDTALVLLKAGAETDKLDVDGHLAIDLAPDIKVRLQGDLQTFDGATLINDRSKNSFFRAPSAKASILSDTTIMHPVRLGRRPADYIHTRPA